MKYKDYARYAYIAGLLDGEGCIYIEKKNPQVQKGDVNKKYNLHILVNMCDGKALDFLQGFVGGYVRKLYEKRENRNTCYGWGIDGTKAKDLLKKCLPFLKTKLPQAELAIRFRTKQEVWIKQHRKRITQNGSKPYEEHILQFCEDCKKRLSEMKKELTPPNTTSETKQTNYDKVVSDSPSSIE